MKRRNITRRANDRVVEGMTARKHENEGVSRATRKPLIPRLLQQSCEWYTPEPYLHAAREVMGGIDLDPASCAAANTVVQASIFYDRATDGLAQIWQAKRVWLNPPYCKVGAMSNQERWSRKLIAEYEAGHVGQAILLVNAATETRWFQQLYDYPICFVKGRIQFWSLQERKSGPTVGSALVYFGANIERFITVFSRFGVVVRSVLPSREPVSLWDAIHLPDKPCDRES